MGEVVHKQPENGAEVVLSSGHCHLDGNWSLRVAVAAGIQESFTINDVECGGGGRGEEADLQSLYARDDGVEGSLDVSGGAGADHR